MFVVITFTIKYLSKRKDMSHLLRNSGCKCEVTKIIVTMQVQCVRRDMLFL